MPLVVDSSVVISICLAGGRLGPLNGHALHGPAHLPAEVTSALREMSYRDDIPVQQADAALGHLTRMPITYDEPGVRAERAFRVAVELGWAKTYDAEYIVLAQAIDAPLVTLDARLQRRASHLVTIVAPSEL